MHNDYIDRMNYENDPRVRARAPQTEITLYHDDGSEEVINLPTIWAICHVCDGEGKHVNPSIDAGGLSAEDFADDPDFLDDYMGGAYDVPCNCCGGSGKVRTPDYDQLTPEQSAILERQEREEAEYRAIERAERIMGA